MPWGSLIGSIAGWKGAQAGVCLCHLNGCQALVKSVVVAAGSNGVRLQVRDGRADGGLA